MTAPQRLTLRTPDDWHLHLRDGAMLKADAAATSAQFRRATSCQTWAPVRRSEDAARYRDAILAAVPPDQALNRS